ncbi:MAG: hypothetical protein ACXVEF_18685 [Polyangiales bacterium]
MRLGVFALIAIVGCTSDPSCPERASTCPSGCGSQKVLRYDVARDCVESAEDFCWASEPAPCNEVTVCKVAADGSMFRASSDCAAPQLARCDGANAGKVLAAPTCGAAVTCPTTAVTDCPSGCTRVPIERYDDTKSCLVATNLALCFPPPPRARCLGLASCRRDGDGKLYRVPSVCALDGFEFCAGAEDTRVASASSCDAG